MAGLTLRESLAVIAYRDSLTFPQYRLLSEWLGCYQYILPISQEMAPSMLSLSPAKPEISSTLQLYYYQILLSKCYTLREQSNIIRYILCYLNQPLQF